MKKTIYTIIVCMLAISAKAQIGYNYSQYDFGVGVANTKLFSDFAKAKGRYAFNASFSYNKTPFVNFIAELQVGSMATDTLSLLGSPINFTNDFSSLGFRAQIQAGELMDYSHSAFKNALKNFYISAGIGVIYNDFKYYDTGVIYQEDKNSNVFIPVKAGYEFKIFNSYNEPNTKVDIGYQLNYLMTDNFDTIRYGKYNDAFGQWVLSLKFAIGGSTSYRKQINY